MVRHIFLLVITIQLVAVGYLSWRVYQNLKPNPVLGTISVNPIPKENIQIDATNSAELKHFYEPTPNKIESETVVGMDYQVNYNINQDALNSLKDYDVVKPPSTFRIITLGDSYTFGHFVNTKDNYPSQLEQMLNASSTCSNYSKYEVINLGMKGYDLRYSVERFKKRGVKYQPDLIVWFVKSDDFEQIQEELADSFKRLLDLGYPWFDEQTMEWIIPMMATKELREKRGDAYIYSYQREVLYSIRKYSQKPILFLAMLPKEHSFILNEFIEHDAGRSLAVNNLTLYEKERFIDQHPNEIGHRKIASKLFESISQKVKETCN